MERRVRAPAKLRPAVLRAGLILAIVFCGAAAPSAVAAGTAWTRLQILQQLRSSRFAVLDTLFGRLDAEYRSGAISDYVVERAYMAFRSADPDLQPPLNAWVDRSSETPTARMARGQYFLNLAWVSRGTAYARQTGEGRFKEMRGYLRLAAADFLAAYKRAPKSGLAHSALIEVAMLVGKTEEIRQLAGRGLTEDPRSFAIRRRFLYSLLPWWGGNASDAKLALTPPDILNFVAQVRSDAETNPPLWPLAGFSAYTIAEIAIRQDRRKYAAEMFDEALRYGEFWWYRHRQGVNFMALDRPREAIESFTKGLEAEPMVPMTLNERAWAYRKLDDLDHAMADWALALALDPRDPDILRGIAFAQWASGSYDAAHASLDKALLYGADDHQVRSARGRLLLYKLKRPAEALGDLKRATELRPRDDAYWYNYVTALFLAKDCKIKGALESYLGLCGSGVACPKKELEWATGAAEHFKTSGLCP